jgi:uncharacterized protein
VSDLFAPAARWQRLPAVAAQAARLSSLVANVVSFAVLAVPVGIWWNWWGAAAIAVFGFGWTIWRIVRAGRWIHSYGYSEREHDLLITHGLWFKKLTAVPYGRMLSVEVESGPIDRLWGLAEVTLVTASSHSNAKIPGLPATDAAVLRDRLIRLGEAQALPL